MSRAVTLQALPDHKTRAAAHYLYAAEFADGTVKIGVTWNPKDRMQSLQQQYRRKVVRVHVAPYHNKWRYQAERAVLVRCLKIGTVVEGKELFAGVTFGEAATLVTQMARRKFAFMHNFKKTRINAPKVAA